MPNLTSGWPLKAGYCIIGGLIALYLLSGKIAQICEYNWAYKNPAKNISKMVDSIKTLRVENSIKAHIISEITEKLNVAVTGNARVEKRPDGTQVITGDNIVIGSETDKKKTADTDSTTVSNSAEKTKEKDKEIDTPVLPGIARNWGLGVGTNFTIGEYDVIVTHRLFGDFQVFGAVQFELAPALRLDGAFVGILYNFTL